jgi:hypothetical protein
MNPTWVDLYAPVVGHHVAAQNDAGWMLDASGNLYGYDPVANSWSEASSPSAHAIVTLSACVDGSLLAVDSSGSVYLYSYPLWTQVYISAYAVVSGAAGDVSDVLVVDTTGAITESAVGVVTTLSTTGPSQVSATAFLTQIWGVKVSSGTVYKWNTSSWSSVSGKSLKQIHVSHSSTGTVQVVGVDSLGGGWSYNITTSTWSSIPVPNSGNLFTALEAGAGYIWALLTTGDVYRGII